MPSPSPLGSGVSAEASPSSSAEAGGIRTLAEMLGATTPVSVLLRKARRLGIGRLDDLVQVAVHRGCRHYASALPLSSNQQDRQTRFPTLAELPNDELTVLLLVGELPYEPQAVRCAAQLARAADVSADRLADLAIREKCERVLAHIARAGREHDDDGTDFWGAVLSRLGPVPERMEHKLPHWTRFVSMAGRQRSGPVPPRWLIPQR